MKVALVTGGSQGIGEAVARLAASRGYAVAISYRTGADKAKAVVAAIEAAGGKAVAIQADGADAAQVSALFRQVDEALGPVTALVNNAGITGPVAKLDEVTGDIVDDVMGINVRGVFLATREAIGRMATDKGGAGGAIVNISSRASEIGGGGEWVHYAASKGAVDTFTIGASRELARRGIRVNAVNPGLIDTEIHAKAGMPDRIDKMGPMIPMGRAGTAEEVAKVVLWLLSDEASYVTGALVPVGGGR